MAGGVTFDSGNEILRSPRQATNIFGLGGARPPRQKNTFVVNFRKNGDTTTSTGTTTTSSSLGTGTWNKDLGFLVKSVDRPSVEPKTEEVNQYNKKRIVHTGYKIGTTRITLYDTVDSMAMRMWSEYSKYYFGDFRHQTSTTDFQFDTTLSAFKDTGNLGFGFAPQSSTSTTTSTTSDYATQFFFDTISVYQVFGKKFVQFDLINPKITSFDPDELDYSNSEIATFTLQIACEAVIYKNDFQPQDISGDSFLKEAFGDIAWLDGDVLDYPGQDSTASISYPSSVAASTVATPYYTNPVVQAPVALQTYESSISAGSLNAYGQFNFGSTTTRTNDVVSLATDIALNAITNPALASVLRLNDRTTYGDASVRSLTQPYTPPTYISQAAYDEARAAVTAIGGQNPDTSPIAAALTYAVLSSALATGTSARDQMYNRKPPADGYPNSWSSADAQGIALTNESFGIVNAQRAPSTQIGFNQQNNDARIALQPGAPVSIRPMPQEFGNPRLVSTESPPLRPTSSRARSSPSWVTAEALGHKSWATIRRPRTSSYPRIQPSTLASTRSCTGRAGNSP
jgi:hypothetical protein